MLWSDGKAIDLLRLHASSRGLDEEQLRVLAAETEIVRYREGEVVLPANVAIDALYLVFSGRLTISTVLPGGKEKSLYFLTRDDQLGLLALSQPEPLPLSAVAEEQSTLLRIDREAALGLLRRLPLWARNLMKAAGPRVLESVLGEKLTRPCRNIAIVHASDETRFFTPILVRRLFELGESVGLISDHAEVLAGGGEASESLVDDRGRPRNFVDLRGVVARWQERDRVVMDLSLRYAAEHMEALMSGVDATFWISTSASAERVAEVLRPLSSSSREKNRVVWALRDDEPVAPVRPSLGELGVQDFKLNGRSHPEGSRPRGLERIVHHLRGVSIGLALGGGGARGMAHLGVLQILEEKGITIDRMSGTSAGALTGIMHAAGISADELIEIFARDLKPAWYYRWLPQGDGLFMARKFRGRGWESMLRGYLHDWKLEQLAVPCCSMTADLVSASEVIRREGDAVRAILESINLPIISRPICRDGQVLVDGGVLKVVPADVLVQQGANIVIAVDVASRIRFEFVGNRADSPTSEMKVPNAAQTAIRLRTIQDHNLSSAGAAGADLIIEPDVSTVLLSDFQRAPAIAELGRVAAEEAVPELRTILRQVDPQLFAGS